MLVDVSLEPGTPCRFDYLQLEDASTGRRRFVTKSQMVIPGMQLRNSIQDITFLPNRKDLGRFCQEADTGTVVESEGNIVNVRFRATLTFTFFCANIS